MDGTMLVIDRDAARPIGVQLVDGLRRGILRGALQPGDPVPSTRALAAELGVSRSAVVSAYEQLAGEGYLEMRQGAATRVADLHPGSPNRRNLRVAAGNTHGSRRFESAEGAPEAPEARETPPEPPRIDLLPGRPSTARFDTRAWRAAWRAAAARDIPSESPPPFGVPRLRDEIADHLRIARGVACDAADIVVTAGTSEALSLSASALAIALARPPVVAVEHPGYPSARRALELHGAQIVPVPVDADGLDVGALRRMPQRPDAVMVTPSHQYPLGGRLPVASRLELLEWARESGAIVLEDDYDSEYRHLGPPLPALASLDGGSDAERVVLVGSFSKVLTPWLRVGFLVLPENPRLRAAYASMRAGDWCPVPGVVQDAVAALLASGAVRRHIAVTRRDYAHRRRLVLEALDGLPGAPLSGLDGGLHAVVRLPDLAASDAVIARLGAEGVAVAPLAEYSALLGDELPGFVIGYAGVTDTLLIEGLSRIQAAIRDAVDGE